MLDIRYLAGFFDGEGCVLFHYLKRNQRIRPEVEVAQTKLPILMEFQKRFGGSVIGPQQNNSRSKPYWRWIALSEVCMSFLRKIEKHVTVRHPQVKLMLEYDQWKKNNKRLYKRNINGQGRVRTEHTMRMLKTWRAKMQKLNKRGAL